MRNYFSSSLVIQPLGLSCGFSPSLHVFLPQESASEVAGALEAKSSPPPGFALQTPYFSIPPWCTSGHPSQTGACTTVTWTVCIGLTATKSPLLSQLIFSWVRGLPQMQEPLLTFSSPPGAQVISCFLSSSFSLLSFVLSVTWGSLLSF